MHDIGGESQKVGPVNRRKISVPGTRPQQQIPISVDFSNFEAFATYQSS